MKAFKQASVDRAMKVLFQFKSSSKPPWLTESRGELGLECTSSLIKICRQWDSV